MSENFKSALEAGGTEKMMSAVQKKTQSNYLIGQPLPEAVDGTVPADGRTIEIITAEVRFYTAQAAQSCVEIGKRLVEAKEKLPHGLWSVWLRDSVEFSQRTANRFMQVAREFLDLQPVANLPYAKMLALVQISPDELDDFVTETHAVNGEEKTVDDMTTRELQTVIKERDEEKKARRAAEEKASAEQFYRVTLAKESKLNFDKYMASLVTIEEKEKSISQIREMELIQRAQLKEDIERRVGDQVAGEIEQLRQENNDLQKQLDSGKITANTPTRNYDKLSEETTELAGVIFCDALDNAYALFEPVARCSQPEALTEAVGECITACEALARRLNQLRRE